MTRREFPAKVRLAAFQRADGHCEDCRVRLSPGRFAYDHIVPDALGGEPTLDNCMVLCRACHGAKTAKADVPRIAKAKRVERDRAGIRKPSRLSHPTLKRKLDGSVVPR
jgi:5-methylcytosine-specific restriction protein A